VLEAERRCAIDPLTTFCPNMECPARAQVGEGNISIHSRKRQRYWCKVCEKAFSARAGTPFYRRRTDEETITRVVTLVSHGCPIPAVEAAYGFQAQTVREWVEVSGAHMEAVHQAEVVQPRDLVQVQADEIHVKTQAGVLWMALAMMVSTRLWLGGAVSLRRDRDLITRLLAIVARCAQWGPLLFVSDGLSTYIDVVRKAFRTRQTGTRGRPRLIPWPELAIAQVVKQYAGRAVTGTVHRLVQGSTRLFLTLLWSTPGCQVLNTAYIERLNGTFRSRLAVLGRRTRRSARNLATIAQGMYLVGTVYNFCTTHDSLPTVNGRRQTPAMAAGITDHVWTVSEVLHYQVPPPRWEPPRRRGRCSKAFQALIDRWCPNHRLA
jgi:transposase-like protein